MGYAWTRCRRCARPLKNAQAVRTGYGADCAAKTGITARGEIMRLVDAVLDGADKLPPEGRGRARDAARSAAHLIELGRRVAPRLHRYLEQTTRTIQWSQTP